MDIHFRIFIVKCKQSIFHHGLIPTLFLLVHRSLIFIGFLLQLIISCRSFSVLFLAVDPYSLNWSGELFFRLWSTFFQLLSHNLPV